MLDDSVALFSLKALYRRPATSIDKQETYLMALEEISMESGCRAGEKIRRVSEKAKRAEESVGDALGEERR